eukprot:scaffold24859_cov71-Phaeocystis_antarctica.AAC.4
MVKHKSLFWIVLTFAVANSPVEATCSTCFGYSIGCTFDANGKCPAIDEPSRVFGPLPPEYAEYLVRRHLSALSGSSSKLVIRTTAVAVRAPEPQMHDSLNSFGSRFGIAFRTLASVGGGAFAAPKPPAADGFSLAASISGAALLR